LSVLDEFTRECLGILAAFSIHAEDVIAFLAAILQQHDAPVFLRSDNGSEFTAETVQSWLADIKVGPAFIPPGQPWKMALSKVSTTNSVMSACNVNGSPLYWTRRL
jgi:transposase InsO family protein